MVTGYFGPLTEAAVKRFQQKYGIEPIGIVGPKTRAVLNKLTVELYEKEKAKIIAADNQKLALAIQEGVNRQRINNGLTPLNWDQALSEIARGHSKDQAQDNIILTKPDLLCHYPIIRHEGKIFGFSLRDRLTNYNLSYRSAGENIAIIPKIKFITYKYDPARPPLIDCPVIEQFTISEGLPEERMRLYQEALNQRAIIIASISPVQVVSKDWRTEEEITTITIKGWMDSAGHRQNILNPEFNFGGVGIAQANDYLIITHNMISR